MRSTMMQTPLSLDLPHFARWQVPDGFAFAGALPRTATGTFMKTRLRQDFKDRVSATPE